MEKDFYKKIKNILNNPPEFTFEESEWTTLQERLKVNNQLEQKPNWKKYGWIFLWLLPFFLIGGFSWYKINQANERISKLQTDLDIKNITFQSDTIVQHTLIQQYDTIYHTTHIWNDGQTTAQRVGNRNYSNPAFIQSGISTRFLNDFEKNIKRLFADKKEATIAGQFLTRIRESLYENFLTKEKIPGAILSYNEAAIKEELSDLAGLNLEKLSLPLRELDLFKWFESTFPIYKKEVNPLLFMKPTGFRVSAGFSKIKLIGLSGEDKKGFTGGLMAEINFGNQLSMFFGGEYLNLRYKLEEEEELDAYPKVNPDNQMDELEHLKVTLNYLQIPFGMKYRFRPNSAFRPYLGIGFIARRAIRQELKYEFSSGGDEYDITTVIKNNAFTVNTLRGSFGAEIPVFKKWNAFLEGTYDHDFQKSKNDFERIKYFNLKTGILYDF